MSVLPTPTPADPVAGQPGHFTHTNWVKTAIIALDTLLATVDSDLSSMLTELGTNPSGLYATVVGRLDAVDDTISAMQAAASPWVVVAAADSSDEWKAAAGASRTCDGVADDVQLQAAINLVRWTSGTGETASGQNYVIAAPGNYYFSATPSVHGRVVVRGASMLGTTFHAAADHSSIGTSGGLIAMDDNQIGGVYVPYEGCGWQHLTLHGGWRDMRGLVISATQTDPAKDDNHFAGSPDWNARISDLNIVAFGRAGVYAAPTGSAHLTTFHVNRVRVFDCGGTLAEPGQYWAVEDSHLTGLDTGSQGNATVATAGADGVVIGGANNIVNGVFGWLCRGTGVVISGSIISVDGVSTHHNYEGGLETSGNRIRATNFLASNNGSWGVKVIGNTTTIRGHFFDDADSAGVGTPNLRPTEYGVWIANQYGNQAGHDIEVTVFGSGITPLYCQYGDSILEARGNRYLVIHTGNNQNGDAGTKQVIDWQEGIRRAAGSGDPNGTVLGSKGSTYSDWTNGVLYVKATGAGVTNSGWAALATV